ncbi:WD40-repeat-containing domain protein [Syncephalastrum racemosum]|uniref:WD40-repeat-containing domain protein n=1 Tax=Syncephalastrum racemosum TaxID=13706 RepID=A0A1X2HD37_SYNRA|nr:WD40-repeat-containing domain protein [Syncephalastrum racemosum]
MSSITKFDTSHEDLVHDVAYDFYGKRLVTCSSDQRLKVWDYVERDRTGRWELNDAWKAHDSSILKAIWAHPEYGQVIASCSFDRQVKIWEEQPFEPKLSQKRWIERFRLVESRGAVLDVAFAPTQGALRLATCSADGIVRIYEAIEPTNLAQWSQMEEFEIATSEDAQQGAAGTPAGRNATNNTAGPGQSNSTPPASTTSIPSPFQPQPQTPVHIHSTSSSNSSLASYGLSTPGMETPAGPLFPALPGSNPSNNPAASTTAIAGQSPTAGTSASAQVSSIGGAMPSAAVIQRPSSDADSGYCLDWCPNRSATAMMVVGLGKETGARIFRHDGHSRWYPGEFLPGHEQEVHDVSWAPSMARSYQLIATACKDHYVRIYKITELPPSNTPSTSQQRNEPRTPTSKQPQSLAARYGQRPLQVELIAAFNDHHAEVWRVEWNVTGTILSSSGDDGRLRLWRAGYDGQWRQMAAVSANQPALT